MTDFARKIAAADMGWKAGPLQVGGIPAEELARRYGTPLYVYDLSAVERDLERLRAAFPPGVGISYSVKANPLLALLAFLARAGCGAEIASAGELEAALAAGFPPGRIVFAGPGKSREEHLAGLGAGILAFHVESRGEADRLAGLAGRGRIPVGLRVNPAPPSRGAGMRMGGGPQPFGWDEEEMEEALDYMKGLGKLEILGLHANPGTQVLSASALADLYAHLFDLARRAAARLGRPLRYLDLGGGLGVPLHEEEAELDLDRLREETESLWEENPGDTVQEVFLEPGRFLAARCGVYLARVVDVKTSRGRRFLVLDGGMSSNALASGTLGQVFRRNLPVLAAWDPGASPAGKATLVGPLCTPLDTLARDLPFPEAGPGDLVAFLRCGAYAFTASHPAFLSHPSPPEVVILEGQSWLARPGRPGRDWLLGQRVPPPLKETEEE